jgi:hypothetical protein
VSDRNIPTEQQLTPLGNERFNVPAILHFIDAEAKNAYGGSERTQIQLVARLVRAQRCEIERLRGVLKEIADARPSCDGCCFSEMAASALDVSGNLSITGE